MRISYCEFINYLKSLPPETNFWGRNSECWSRTCPIASFKQEVKGIETSLSGTCGIHFPPNSWERDFIYQIDAYPVTEITAKLALQTAIEVIKG